MMKKRILKYLIDFCGVLVPNDTLLVHLARRVGLRGKPQAQRHLDHYLYGQGQVFEIRTNQLLEEDPNVRHYLFQQLATALTTGLHRGAVPIPQSMYLHPDWRCALGGIEIKWRFERGQVMAWFKDRYYWKPHEGRATQRVHRAAENLKTSGAQEFIMEGSAIRIPLKRIQKRHPFVKLDRLML